MRVLACLLLSGCSAILDFNQCSMDQDCQLLATDGGAAYCTSDHICVSTFPEDRICTVDPSSSTDPNATTIAGLFRLTGPTMTKDQSRAKAVSLAVNQINQQGTRKLRLVLCDTAGVPAQAQEALKRAVSYYGAVASVGPDSSAEIVGLAQPGSNLIQQLQVVVVSASATAPAISTLQTDVAVAPTATSAATSVHLLWRTCASDNLQAKVLATLVPASTTTISTAYVNSTYGSGLNGAFTTALGATLPGVIPTAKTFDQGTSGATIASFLAMATPQVALVVADADAPTWIAGLAGVSGLETTKFLFTDGAKSPSLFSQGPSTDVLTRTQGTAPATPSGPVFNAFKGSYIGQYAQDPTDTAFVANAWDATFAIALAMASIPSNATVNGISLALGMTFLSDPHAQSFNASQDDFAAAYSTLQGTPTTAGVSINLQGASGPIDFDPTTGDILTAPVEVWAVDTSMTTPQFVTVKNVTP